MHIKQTRKSNAQPNLLKEHVLAMFKVIMNINNEPPTASISHSRVAVIKAKNCKIESSTNQYKSE